MTPQERAQKTYDKCVGATFAPEHRGQTAPVLWVGIIAPAIREAEQDANASAYRRGGCC